MIAGCWQELEVFVSDSRVTTAVIDPAADGKMDVDSVIGLMISQTSLPVFAYVPPTPWHLKAIFKLSKHGLKGVFLHALPKLDLKFSKTVKAVEAKRFAFDFLSRFETRLTALPPELSRAVQDLFERPNRYERAADIATQAGVPVKALYRHFDSARIGTPNKLITAAKVLRGYTTLRSSLCTIRGVSDAVGFENSKRFRSRTATIFGCSPKKLRTETNSEEVVLHLIEWIYKPTRRTPRPTYSAL